MSLDTARTTKLGDLHGHGHQKWTITADGAGTQLRNSASSLRLADPAQSRAALASHPRAATGT